MTMRALFSAGKKVQEAARLPGQTAATFTLAEARAVLAHLDHVIAAGLHHEAPGLLEVRAAFAEALDRAKGGSGAIG